MKKIIIASHEKDESALFLLRKITDKRLPVELVNLSKFSTDIFGSMLYDSDNTVNLRTPNGTLDMESIKSIWWRRPKGGVQNLRSSLMEQYINVETDVVINSIFKRFADVLWVSEPESTRNANIKPLQLILAKDLGFRIPISCVSNDPEIVRSFIEKHPTIEMIIKPVGSAFVRLSYDIKDRRKQNRTIFTRIIDKNILQKNDEAIKACPFILQEAIKKSSDIRVTIVGDDVFASEILIDTKGDKTLVDWRHYSTKREYRAHVLPKEVETLSRNIVKELGLKFGCIDLAFSKEEGYTFFEINPQGQWLPSELLAGNAISKSLIKLLER